VAALFDETVVSIKDDRIFRRWNPRSFNKYWTTTCDRAKVVDLHFHDLRHTFATRLKAMGIGMEVREALLGHKLPGLITYYAHDSAEWRGMLRQAVTALETAYEPPMGRGSYREVSQLVENGEPPGTRTRGPRLKRAMLYRLS